MGPAGAGGSAGSQAGGEDTRGTEWWGLQEPDRGRAAGVGDCLGGPLVLLEEPSGWEHPAR